MSSITITVDRLEKLLKQVTGLSDEVSLFMSPCHPLKVEYTFGEMGTGHVFVESKILDDEDNN